MRQFYLKDERPPFIISVRFLTALIIFFGYCFQYMIKINLSIGKLLKYILNV